MKLLLNNCLLHFWKICVHKYWVAYYCFKCGLYWQGIWHDMSKFSPIEFWESVRYYQGDKSPINACKEDKGYSLAWQHHKGRNPHHYEYWTDNYDTGTVALEMPYKYAVELVCDWLGAGRAYMGNEFTYIKEWEWWRNKIETHYPKIHENTIKFITILLKSFAKLEFDKKNPDEKISEDLMRYIYQSHKLVKENVQQLLNS